MADISKLTLPNGATYTIKDEVARAAISKGITLKVVETLPEASAETAGSIYLILSTRQSTSNIYDEYITVNLTESTYSWEKIGTTDIDLSGYSTKGHTHSVTSNVAVSDHTYTPSGTVTGEFTGSEMTSSGEFTPTGIIDVPTINVFTKDIDEKNVTLYSITDTGAYTASTWTDGSYTESSYTPETYTVSDGNLIITNSSYTKENIIMPSYTAESVTLPSREIINVTANSTQPSFTGSKGSVTVKGTPAGSLTNLNFSGTTSTIGHAVYNNTVVTNGDV